MNPQPTRYRRGRSSAGILLICTAAALAAGCLLFMRTAFGQPPPKDGAPGVPASQPVGDLLPPPAMPEFEPPERPNHFPPPPREEPLWPLLGEFYPEHVRQLEALRERNPRKFAQVERQMRPWLRELREAREQNPQLAQLMVHQHRNEIAIREWQHRFQAAEPEQRQALLPEGRQLAEARVDLRLQRDRMRIHMLETRLQHLKAGLDEREARKESIVDREFDAMQRPPPPHPASRPTH
jgi:hypothetical protein